MNLVVCRLMVVVCVCACRCVCTFVCACGEKRGNHYDTTVDAAATVYVTVSHRVVLALVFAFAFAFAFVFVDFFFVADLTGAFFSPTTSSDVFHSWPSRKESVRASVGRKSAHPRRSQKAARLAQDTH